MTDSRPPLKFRLIKYGFYYVGAPLEFEEVEIPSDDPDYEDWLELDRQMKQEAQRIQ